MIDQALRTELKLVIENDGELYLQQTSPIQENLRRRWRKGQYDHGLAPKLWRYLVDNGARKYQKEYPGLIVDGATRQAIAQDFADEWREELMITEVVSAAPAPKPKKKAAKKKTTKKKAAKRRTSKKINIRGVSPDHDGDWRSTIQRTRLYARKHIGEGNFRGKISTLEKAWSDHAKLIVMVEGIDAGAPTGKLSVRDRDLKHRAGDPLPPGYQPWGLFRGNTMIASYDLRREAEAAMKKATAKRKTGGSATGKYFADGNPKKKAVPKKRTPADNECRLSWSGADYSAAKVADLLDMAPWKLTAAQAKVRSSLKSGQPIKCTVVQTAHAQLVRKAKAKTKGGTLADTIQGALAQGLDDKEQFRVGAGARPKVSYKR